MAKDVDAPLRSEPALDEVGLFNVRYAEFFDLLGVNNNEFIDRLLAIELRLDLIEGRLDVIEDRLDAIDIRLDLIEGRLDTIELRLDAIELRLDAIELRLDLVEGRVTYLEGLTVVTAIDHTVVNTVTGIQTIICTDDLTVDLILAPNDRDKVVVVSKGNNIVIDGNGKTIDGDSTVTLRNGFEIGLQMEYSSAQDEWFQI